MQHKLQKPLLIEMLLVSLIVWVVSIFGVMFAKAIEASVLLVYVIGCGMHFMHYALIRMNIVSTVFDEQQAVVAKAAARNVLWFCVTLTYCLITAAVITQHKGAFVFGISI